MDLILPRDMEEGDLHPEVLLPYVKIANGPCPYRAQGEWDNMATQVSSLSNSAYEHFLNRGFRRMGKLLYRPICASCRMCVPIRVDVQAFKPSKSQRRTWRRNQDVRVVHGEAVDRVDETYALYEKYQKVWHDDKHCSFDSFEFSFLTSPVRTEVLHYFVGDRRVAVGWVDRLNTLLSSVYFVFDPEEAGRRLGVYSILYEIEYARSVGLKWLYLGYWVPESAKMSYKAEYDPKEVLFREHWRSMDVFDADALADPLSPLLKNES